MRGDVFIDSPEDFAKWQSENQQAPDEAPPQQEKPTATSPEEKK